MSGSILTFPEDTAVSAANDYVATEKVSDNRVLRQRVRVENLEIRPGQTGTARKLSAVAGDLDVTAGTVTASKALVVDANKDLATLRHLTISGNFVTGATTLSETDLAKIDAITNGTSAAAKAMVTDASNQMDGVPLAERVSVDPSQKVTYYTDFLGDTLEAELMAGVGSGTGNAVALSPGAGGRVEIKTASDDGAHGANGSSIGLGALDWRADQGGLCMEVRLQLDAITDVALFVGFTDALPSTVEAPIFLVAADIDSDADNACGVGFDTDGSTVEFFHGGVKATADTTPAYSGGAPSIATYVTIRVEVSAAGAVTGYINGTAIGAAVANAVTTTTPLCPIVFVHNRGAAVRNCLLDYFWVQANR